MKTLRTLLCALLASPRMALAERAAKQLHATGAQVVVLDRIETVTVDSVFAWLNRSGLGGPVQVIR